MPTPPAASTPAPTWRLLTMEASGSLTATQAKAVLAELLADGGGDPAAIAAARASRRCPRTHWSPPWPRRWPPIPTSGRATATGEDKLAGFFTGEVMKATRGQADGKAVAAELRRLRG